MGISPFSFSFRGVQKTRFLGISWGSRLPGKRHTIPGYLLGGPGCRPKGDMTAATPSCHGDITVFGPFLKHESWVSPWGCQLPTKGRYDRGNSELPWGYHGFWTFSKTRYLGCCLDPLTTPMIIQLPLGSRFSGYLSPFVQKVIFIVDFHNGSKTQK
jgi:hypothetical protein